MNTFDLLTDGFFAAIAAIGFGSISNVPYRSFSGCAILAALGHSLRFLLMHGCGCFIIGASFAGGLLIGMLSIPMSRRWHCPAEALSFPALLPMIPGMYAYRCVQALTMCLRDEGMESFTHYFMLFNYNGMVCIVTIALMVIGVTVPIFIFRKNSFSATR